MHKGPVSRRAFAVLGAKMLCCGMGVNQSRLIRAMHGNRGGIQRRAPAAPARDEVSVSGFSTPRRQSGRVYEQTIYGKNLHKINRPNGARLGTRALPVIAASSDGQQLVVRAPSSRGIEVTNADKLILTGNRDGTLYSWVFGPNDVGAPKGFRFGGDGSSWDKYCIDEDGYFYVCGKIKAAPPPKPPEPYQMQMGLSAGPPGGPLPPGYPPGGGPPPPPPPPPNPYQKQMGLKTAQASGRNRARLSRFTNVRRR